MAAAALSMFVFGIYLGALGAILMIAPNAFLAVFVIAATQEIWIRVVGMLVLLLGFYYLRAGLDGNAAFARSTLFTRPTVPIFFLVFVLAFGAPPILILFGVIELAGAVWTAVALRHDLTTSHPRLSPKG